MTTQVKTRTAAALLAAVAPVLILSACSSSDGDKAGSSASQQQSALAVSDQWVKAAPDGMTAMFGKLTNNGDAEIRVVGGESPAAGMVQLHEMSAQDGTMAMREKKDGYVIAPHSSLELAPGADHIMLMDLRGPITAGQEVTVELLLADGSKQTVTAVARDFAGNQENYQP